jgi:hypothetical protein
MISFSSGQLISKGFIREQNRQEERWDFGLKPEQLFQSLLLYASNSRTEKTYSSYVYPVRSFVEFRCWVLCFNECIEKVQYPRGHVPRRNDKKYHWNGCKQPADLVQRHQARSLVAVCEQKSSGAEPARYEVRAIEDSLANNSDKLRGSDGELVDRHREVGWICGTLVMKTRSS